MLELLNEIIISMVKTSPFIALLIYGIYYLNKENKELKADNKELNKYVRESETRNTQILAGVTTTLDKLIDKTDTNIDHLKEFIDLKLREKR